MANAVSLNDLSRLVRQLNADNEQSLRELQARDNSIVHSTAGNISSYSDVQLLKHWLDKVSPANTPTSQRSANIESSISLWLSVLGLIFGIVVMSGLLLTGHQVVINVILFLALFIGTQMLLLLVTAIATISAARGFLLHLPLENFNPARLLFRRTLHRVTGSIRWESILGKESVDIVKLALLRWGQFFGVAFNVGGIIAFFIVLAATDRSFGWSSTFNISAENWLRVTQIISLPWSWFAESATVNLDIVESSRYLSLQKEFTAVQIHFMRQWWPFLFACIVCYGLLPRLILLAVFHFVYRRRLTTAFLRYPGVSLLVARMRHPQVQTQNPAIENAAPTKNSLTQSAFPAENVVVVSWTNAESCNREQLHKLGITHSSMHVIGLDLQQEQNTLQELQQSHSDNLIIIVKSWEPPLEELADFIARLPHHLQCYLLLLSLPNKGVAKDEWQDWQQFAFKTKAQLLLGDDPQN